MRNPHNIYYSPGSNSGGSAAAVAAGVATFGFGEDGAGSVRIPASFCGVIGLKPDHDLGKDWASGSASLEIFAPSVLDTTAMLKCALNDPLFDLQWQEARNLVHNSPRIAVSYDFGVKQFTKPYVHAAIECAVKHLTDRGYSVQTVGAIDRLC